MVGVPAKRIGWVSKAGVKLDKSLKCPIDGTKYTLKNNKLSLSNN